METYNGAPISYSLGNFMANNVYWRSGSVLEWDRFERTGFVLLTDYYHDGSLSVRQVPTFDDRHMVSIDHSAWGSRCLEKANYHVSRGVSERQYGREAFRVRKIKPLLNHLRWSKLRQARPVDLHKAVRLLFSKD
jgi:poly-gamma-glutamate synthesis protein (capsule biosynthesis protein)